MAAKVGHGFARNENGDLPPLPFDAERQSLPFHHRARRPDDVRPLVPEGYAGAVVLAAGDEVHTLVFQGVPNFRHGRCVGWPLLRFDLSISALPVLICATTIALFDILASINRH